MTVATEIVEVDFDNDGVFNSVNEDVTPNVLSLNCRRDSESTGRFQAVLKNTTGLYSPLNTASALTGLLVPGRKLRYRAGFKLGTGVAAQFTRANSEYLSIADSAVLSTGDIAFTVAGWVYLDSKPGDEALISKWTTTGNQREYKLAYISASDRFRFDVSNDGTAAVTIAANTLGIPATATWYFVVAWHDPTANTINIQVNNGAADSAAHATGVFNSTASVILGATGVFAELMDGRVDEVGFWKRTLTTAEKTWLYNSGSGRAYIEVGQTGTNGSALRTSLVSWWGLDETSGTRYDAHGTNHLTDNATVTSNPGKAAQTLKYLWVGFLDHAPMPTVVSGPFVTATLRASGPFFKLSGPHARASPTIQQAVPTGTVIGAILDAVSWAAADRILDAGNHTLAVWAVEDVQALEAMRQVNDTEQGHLYEGLAWDVIFEERYHRDIDRLTSQATFSDAAGAARPYRAIEQSDPLEGIINDVALEVQPRSIAVAVSVLWTLQNEIPVLAAGASITYVAKVSGTTFASQSWTTPVVGTDITQTGVANGNIAVSVTKRAKTMDITITNNHGSAAATLTLVQARGIAVTDLNPYKVKSVDATSQTAYGLRQPPSLASGLWYANSAYAQGAADYMVARNKDPLAILKIELAANRDATLLTEALTRVISERVTVVANAGTQLGINQDFYIEGISHEAGEMRHLTTYDLSPAVADPGWFILDSSTLNGAKVLAY